MAEASPLFEQLKQAVQKAGALAVTHFGTDISIETKADGTKVTAADYAVNNLLHDHLAPLSKDIGWLSEETPPDDRRLTQPRIWIIDPIDGTHAFLRGDPDWTIVAALIENNEPVIGAVFNPVTEQLFMAEKNNGATLNGNPIHTTAEANLKTAHIIAPKSQFNRVFKEADVEPRRSWRCSMAYRIALVASGDADATISLTPKCDWDIAAADLILKEAGGKISTQSGVDLSYNKPKIRHTGVVASNGPLFNTLIKKTANAH